MAPKDTYADFDVEHPLTENFGIAADDLRVIWNDPEAHFGEPALNIPPSPKTTLEERIAARIARVTGPHRTI